MTTSVKRCGWCTDHPLYLTYHDEEWGVPCHNELHLFEMLVLEGAQAGLSWLTILKKRLNYQRAFAGFDPAVVAEFGQDDVTRLLADQGIIRNRLKIQAAINNARALIRLKEDQKDVVDFLWSFVAHRPLQNVWRELSEIPAQTPESEKMSRALKKKGVQLCRTDNLLCLHAGNRHGKRSPGRLFSSPGSKRALTVITVLREKRPSSPPDSMPGYFQEIHSPGQEAIASSTQSSPASAPSIT